MTLDVSIALAQGTKVNQEAPMPYLIETPGKTAILDASVPPLGARVEPPSSHVQLTVPIEKSAPAGETFTLKLSLSSYQCKEGVDGFCRVNDFVWNIPVTLSGEAAATVKLSTTSNKTQN
ncbi:MAG: hypothetical protein NVSMB14_06780 [Isosphaeraceae bacterium]